MAKDGVICLSESLPKQPEQIEELVQRGLIDANNEDDGHNHEECEDDHDEIINDLDFARG